MITVEELKKQFPVKQSGKSWNNRMDEFNVTSTKINSIRKTADMPKRVQRKRTKGWRMPANTVYVGRPSKWGNPFRQGVDGNIDTVLFLYKRHLEQKLKQNPHFLEPLRGKDLACWCPLDKPCHADVILKLLKEASG